MICCIIKNNTTNKYYRLDRSWSDDAKLWTVAESPKREMWPGARELFSPRHEPGGSTVWRSRCLTAAACRLLLNQLCVSILFSVYKLLNFQVRIRQHAIL